MDTFYLGSETTWEDYLKESSFVKDINGQIRNSSKQELVAISKQTREIVASRDALSKKFGAGFNFLSGSIGRDLTKLQKAVAGNTEAIEALRSSFDFNMALLIDQVRLQNQTMLGIVNQMEAIHNTLQNPTLTQAREFFRIGCERMVRGLLDKALAAFLEAEKKDDANFMTQLLIGKLYLYGVNEECSVIDLKKAEEHLRASARYAKAEMKLLPEAGQYAGEALLNAAISCYAQAQDQGMSGNKKEAGRLMQESFSLANEARTISPQLSASHYHYAKMAALIGNKSEAAAGLEKAVSLAEDYCLKADADQDFRFVRQEVNSLFVRMRDETSNDLGSKISRVEKYLTDWVYVSEEAQKAEAQMSQIVQESKQAFQRNTYFDNRDALQLVREADVIFQSLLVHKLSLYTLSAHLGRVSIIAFSPDGKILASGGVDQTVRLWRLSDTQLICTLQGHTDDIAHLAFSHDGTVLASVDKKGAIKLWDVSNGQLIIDLLKPGIPIHCIAFSPKDDLLAAGSFDRCAVLFDLSDGSLLQNLNGHKSSVDAVVFNKAGDLLATGSPDNTASLWDLRSGKKRHNFVGCSGLKNCLLFSSDDQTLITGSNDGSVRFYHVETGELLKTLPGQNGTVSWMALNSTGTALATINYGKALQLWDAASGKLLHELKPFSPGISSVRFSPEETVLAASDYQDRSVKLWNIHDGKLAHVIAGNLTSSAFSTDGTMLVTGDETGSLKFWGRMIRARSTVENHGGPLHQNVRQEPSLSSYAKVAEDPRIHRSPQPDPLRNFKESFKSLSPQAHPAFEKTKPRIQAPQNRQQRVKPQPGDGAKARQETNLQSRAKATEQPKIHRRPQPDLLERLRESSEPPASPMQPPLEKMPPRSQPSQKAKQKIKDEKFGEGKEEARNEAANLPAEESHDIGADMQVETLLKQMYADYRRKTSGQNDADEDPFGLETEITEEDELDQWSQKQHQRIKRRLESKRCLVCGKDLGMFSKLLGIKVCKKHYFSEEKQRR